MATPEQRLRMAACIVDYEARRDAHGKLQVYNLPSGDGGGSYEVAGINDGYHPKEAAALKHMILNSQYEKAEEYIANFLADYTDVVTPWHANAGVEFFLRDCAFNRGPRGSLRILQRAVSTPDDGAWGKNTEAAIAKFTKPSELLGSLRVAREQYERDVAHRDESSKFWTGLSNRWNKAYAQARKFSDESPSVQAPKPVAPTPLSRLPGPLGALLGLIRWRRLPCLALPRGAGGEKPSLPVKKAPQDTLPATPVAPPVPKRTSELPTSPQSPSTGANAPPWYVEALKHVGFHETGENQGIEKFIEGAKCGALGDPWCAIFVNYSVEKANLHGTVSAMARSFETSINFVRLTGPALGAIGTMWRGSRESGQGHVYFYAGEDSRGNVIGLGGNQSDGVRYAIEDMSRNTGWWWPKSAPLPAIGPVRFQGTAIATGSET